jgi:hypothetical protein
MRQSWKFLNPERPRDLRQFIKNVLNLTRELEVWEKVRDARALPFTLTDPPSFDRFCVNALGTVCYLLVRFPRYFISSPVLFNTYLNFAVHYHFNSVESIFRECFNRFTLDAQIQHELDRKVEQFLPKRLDGHLEENGPMSTYTWLWPLPKDPHFKLPRRLPRPDGFTFFKAMQFAHMRRRTRFAHEIWAQRQAWLNQLQERDLTEIGEKYVLTGRDSRAAPGRGPLFEASIRLLYIEIMTIGGQPEEALKLLKSGTGENFEWTQGMLSLVRMRAEKLGVLELCQYIDGLEEDTGLVPTPEMWWMRVKQTF